jgi:hypothetical protein
LLPELYQEAEGKTIATGTFKFFGKSLISVYNGEIDFNSHVIKVMHTSATYTPDQDVHDYKDDVTNEVTGTNVVAGGFTADNCTMTYTGATNVFKLDHDDESIATATASGIATSVWYDSSPATDATRPLLGFVTWDVALSPSAGTLAVNLDAAGLATITPST